MRAGIMIGYPRRCMSCIYKEGVLTANNANFTVVGIAATTAGAYFEAAWCAWDAETGFFFKGTRTLNVHTFLRL